MELLLTENLVKTRVHGLQDPLQYPFVRTILFARGEAHSIDFLIHGADERIKELALTFNSTVDNRR